MLVASILFFALAFIGHSAFWVGVVNRWHGTGYPRKVVKGITLAFYFALVSLPCLVAWRILQTANIDSGAGAVLFRFNGAMIYSSVCAVFGAIQIPVWAWRRWNAGRSLPSVRKLADEIVDLHARIGELPTSSPRTRAFCRIPFNQIWQMHVSEFEVTLQGLPAELDCLSICHISDLHFSPRIDRSYFDEVTQIVNALAVDLVALTGDVCDKARYIDWVPQTLGKMQARVAKFSILGNHDLRTRDVARLRSAMQDAGFLDVGGRLETLRDVPISVAGNERPWFRDAAPSIDRLPAERLNLLLAHTPDQFSWACRQGFDLMLAGHTHGGQIRFPVLGPVICPSWHGTRYSCGFFSAQQTLMHVSRGTASLFPYRMNCRPEITKLVLRCRG